MANMQALCEKYAPSVKAYLLIPLVGSLFAALPQQSGHHLLYQLYLIGEVLLMFRKLREALKKAALPCPE